MFYMTTEMTYMATIAGLFLVILILFWHLGRESAAYARKNRRDERELILQLIKNTRRRSSSDEVNEFRDVIVDKIQNKELKLD